MWFIKPSLQSSWFHCWHWCGNSQSSFFQIFLLFLLFIFLLCVSYAFQICPTLIECSALVSSISLTQSLSSAMSNLLINLSKAFLMFIMLFFISSISFNFFLWFYISLLTLAICSYMLSTLSIRALSMLITALYPPSVNSNKPDISESGSDAHFVSTNCFFAFQFAL